MGTSAKDRQYMSLALELAARARGCTSPNPMVGAVLVRGERIIGRGYHKKAGLPHAEIEALLEAGDAARGATLYVNLEPCNHQGRTPPCARQLIEAGVARVVAAMIDPNPKVSGQGIRALQAAGLEVSCGLMEGEARRLNEAFITFHLKKRPFTIAKWAMSLDGRTSTDTGDSRWISCDASRTYAHEIRASVDAIAVGAGTVFLDNPRLTVRLQDFDLKQPSRVIFDEQLKTPLGAKCLNAAGGTCYLIASESAQEDRVRSFRKAGHTVLQVPGRQKESMERALEMLAEHGIQSLLIEGGRQLHTILLGAGLIDKFIVFIAPKILGGQQLCAPLLNLGITSMKQAIALKNVRIQSFGSDACLEGYINLPPAFSLDDLPAPEGTIKSQS